MTRRDAFNSTGLSIAALSLAALGVGAGWAGAATTETFEVTKTDAEWKKLLSPAAYATLRHEATERAGSSPLLNEHGKGTFNCAGCDLAVYDSATKFESNTGWPSFFDHLPDAIGTKDDNGLFATRTEVHCHRCGGHLGHVFNDGPQPTGLRYCMNGVAFKFKAVSA